MWSWWTRRSRPTDMRVEDAKHSCHAAGILVEPQGAIFPSSNPLRTGYVYRLAPEAHFLGDIRQIQSIRSLNLLLHYDLLSCISDCFVGRSAPSSSLVLRLSACHNYVDHLLCTSCVIIPQFQAGDACRLPLRFQSDRVITAP